MTDTPPTVLATAPVTPAVEAMSRYFAGMMQREMEIVAKIAMEEAPYLSVEEGWRYDVFAHQYVQLALPPAEEAAADTEPAAEAKE